MDRRNSHAGRENGRGALPRAVPRRGQGRFHGARPGSGVGCKKGIILPGGRIRAETQKSVRSAGRFSKKAVIPSFLSRVAKERPKLVASRPRPLARSVSMPLSMLALAREMA